MQKVKNEDVEYVIQGLDIYVTWKKNEFISYTQSFIDAGISLDDAIKFSINKWENK
jgi:hypothetical protein|tara:strand:+ start:983 stop:1150 length:168 start_codon:yes stop_codon:yes gene_type:complete